MSLPLNVVIDIVINVMVVEVVAGLQTLLTRSDLDDIKKRYRPCQTPHQQTLAGTEDHQDSRIARQ